MADGRPQADLDKEFRELKGFWWLEGCYLRSSHDVLQEAECDHCKCIPKEIYYLRCLKHRLCLECKHYCKGYDCLKCGVNTSPEQLEAAHRLTNYVTKYLLGLCPICEEEMKLEGIEYHISERHKRDGSFVQPKIQQKKNEDTTMDVDETCDGKTCDHDFGQCSEEKHKSECPKIERKCFDCGVNVLYVNLQNHQELECQKRVVLCDACKSAMSYDELGDHDQECLEKPVVCDDCEGDVLRKDKFKHASECPLRVVGCENCGGFYAYSSEKEHKYECPKIERECFDCGVKVLNENLKDHLNKECQKRVVFCDACHSRVTCDQLGKHKSECPKIERKCFDCGVNVLYENLQNHQELECQKRVVFCDACNSAMSYDELGDHDQECLEKSVVCDDCKGTVLRKEKSKHASECPMSVVGCENCGGFYAYSSEKEHREQCEKKKLACENCKLELKDDDEKNAHLQICEDALIECAFKEFGCNEKSPRKEMLVHNKDPHNGLLNQVILKAMDAISKLQQKIKEMDRCNMSQREEARNEKAKLEKRIQELENRQLEADQYQINLEDDVKVYRTLLQNLEDKVGRISKELVTRGRVEMLNERVETYLGPLERLLNGLRQVDKE